MTEAIITDTPLLTRPGVEPATVQRPSIDGAQFLPLGLVAPSRFNPRKRFNQVKLEELAASIESVGVLQPVLVRPMPDAKRGGPQYEIVAGERRWRASNLLAERLKQQAIAVIPAVVRAIDDFAALELATVENAQREDIHPIEEAEGYEALLLKPIGGGDFKPPRLRGYSVDEIAARVGKSKGYVHGRLKLLDLIPAGREACFEGKLQVKTAEAVARMPASVQEKALPEVLRGWAGEPWSHRQAVEYLHKNYMLKLASAVFDANDAQLLPEAGSCKACPKRTGANPDLFEDVQNADTCTDPKCFEAKVAAHGEAVITLARSKGTTVLTGAEAKRVMPYGEHSLASSGHVNIDKPMEELTGNRKALRTLLGADFKGTMLLKGEDEELPITIAKVDDVKAALKGKGLLVPSTKSHGAHAPSKLVTAESIKAKRAKRIEEMLLERLPGAVAKHVDAQYDLDIPQTWHWLRFLVRSLWYQSELDPTHVKIAVCGEIKPGSKQGFGDEWIDDLDGEQLGTLVMLLVVGNSVADESSFGDSKTDPDSSNTLAGDIGFPLVALRREVIDEIDAAIKDEIKALADLAKPTAKKQPPPTISAAAQGTTSPPKKKKGKASATKAGQAELLTPEKALARAVKSNPEETGKAADGIGQALAEFRLGPNVGGNRLAPTQEQR